MPKVCLKRIRIGDESFDGEIFLLPDGHFIFIFPDWMEDCKTSIIDHTPELEAFFKAFDLQLEYLIEKLLAINNTDTLHVLIESNFKPSGSS